MPIETESSDDYVTLAAYEKTDDSGISFPEGVTVTLVDKAETGWWCIEYNGEEGWAPADFLEPKSAAAPMSPVTEEPASPASDKAAPARPEAPATKEQSKAGGGVAFLSGLLGKAASKASAAISGKQAEPSAEKSKLKPGVPARPTAVSTRSEAEEPAASVPAAEEPAAQDTYRTLDSYEKADDSGCSFPKGATVTVVEQTDTGWWFIEYNGEEGWAPADFIELASAELESVVTSIKASGLPTAQVVKLMAEVTEAGAAIEAKNVSAVAEAIATQVTVKAIAAFASPQPGQLTIEPNEQVCSMGGCCRGVIEAYPMHQFTYNDVHP